MSNKSTLKKSETNFEKLHSMTDEDIDFSDLPETTPEMWEKGFVRKPLFSKDSAEEQPIDRDIIEFIQTQNRAYRDKINQLLRDYIASHPVK